MPKVRMATIRSGPKGGRKISGGRGGGCDVNTISRCSGSGIVTFFFMLYYWNNKVLIVHMMRKYIFYG